jgi:riboflavin synthase alpha subunit
MASSLTRANARQTARKVNELSEWRIAMARGIKTSRVISSRIMTGRIMTGHIMTGHIMTGHIMTWAAVAWIAVWLTPYLYAVNDLITWR